MTLRAQLQTARLTLRPVAVSDEAAVVTALNDFAVTSWLAVVPWPYTAADFQQFLTEFARPGETFAVEDAAGLAGIIGAGAELGYWYAPRAHGLGYATEAARAVLATQFAHRPRLVTSGYFEGNTRSAHVLAKLGFVETGRRMKFCRATCQDRPHVDLRLTPGAFRAALPIEAHSPRLTYRALQPLDAKALHRIVAHWDVTRQLGPAWPWPADPAFTATRAVPFAGPGFVWGVFQGARLLGTVGVAKGELGYSLSPAAWGKGYATEACWAALTHAFADPSLDVVRAGVWADNAGSLRVLEKLGFRMTGKDCTWSNSRRSLAPGFQLQLDRAAWQASLGPLAPKG
jgi:RimJ/RimL family protein N-acetyltransferase